MNNSQLNFQLTNLSQQMVYLRSFLHQNRYTKDKESKKTSMA
jgi:hypothetical protein